VGGGVVQVAGDAGAFLGDRERPLPLGVALRPGGPVAQVGDLLAAQPGALAGEPRPGPGDPGVQCRHGGKRAPRGGERGRVRDEGAHHGGGRGPRPGLAAGGQQVERGCRAEGQPDRVVQRRQRPAGRRGQREHGHRGPPPPQQRRRRARGQPDPHRVEAARSAAGCAAVREQHHRAGEHDSRYRRVQERAGTRAGQGDRRHTP
jgi:hypothetical protein